MKKSTIHTTYEPTHESTPEMQVAVPQRHPNHLTDLHDGSNSRLRNKLPREQIDRVFASEMCDIGLGFLGFVGIYDRLSQIIPLDWTVIDLGCAYAAQSFFFDRHERYIGVDVRTGLDARFSAHNSQHFLMSISDFLDQYGAQYDQGTTFAICSYVPPWHGDNAQMARAAFQNVFTFYPCSLVTKSPTRPL